MADDENDDKNEKPEQRKNSGARDATYEAMAAERKNWHSFHLSFPPTFVGDLPN